MQSVLEVRTARPLQTPRDYNTIDLDNINEDPKQMLTLICFLGPRLLAFPSKLSKRKTQSRLIGLDAKKCSCGTGNNQQGGIKLMAIKSERMRKEEGSYPVRSQPAGTRCKETGCNYEYLKNCTLKIIRRLFSNHLSFNCPFQC
eukprot:GHVU01067575.1.p1 GENE.GHVU01067575.1~~GHVU01067575.1.p1  ORF type:complete len:144 (+),score=9.31 GHVU01067575.1:921-1352(+)